MRLKRLLTMLTSIILSASCAITSYAALPRTYYYSSWDALRNQTGTWYSCGMDSWIINYNDPNTYTYPGTPYYNQYDFKLSYGYTYSYRAIVNGGGANGTNAVLQVWTNTTRAPLWITKYSREWISASDIGLVTDITQYMGHSLAKYNGILCEDGRQFSFSEYISGSESTYKTNITFRVAHTPGGWVSNDVAHWKVCSGCSAVSDYTAHTFGNWRSKAPKTIENREVII